jgi:uncharacterized membrane-anchored protein
MTVDFLLQEVARTGADSLRWVVMPSSRAPAHGRRLPVLFAEPVMAKVPEITALFWVIKLLTTAGGEATSDYLALGNHLVGAAVETGLLVIGLIWQFGTKRYAAAAYWFLAYAIAIFGTGVSDTLHLDVGIPYSGTTLLWAIVLALVFFVWYRSEGTLSIHSVLTRRREMFYWATVFATFALGTALGDFTASVLHLGYLGSGVLFFVVILIPAVAWRFGMNAIAAFWCAYVVTRPLGASFADYFSKSHHLSGINYGDGPTAAVLLALIVILVGYTAIARYDIQPPSAAVEPDGAARRRAGQRDASRGAEEAAGPVTRNVTSAPARDHLL